MDDKPVQKIIFITGMPGSGKSTQSQRIAEHLGLKHVSAGQCLRDEMNDPNSNVIETIKWYLDRGEIVPAVITIRLLKKKIMGFGWGRYVVLIDGYPRNYENYSQWNEIMNDTVEALHLITFECSNDTSINRIVQRSGEQRSDDKISVVENRIRVYREETIPIVNIFKSKNKCTIIDANNSMEQVWSDLCKVVNKIIN